jgi:hypothetical protein
MANSRYLQTSELCKKIKLKSNCEIGGPDNSVVLSNILRCDAISIC